jgi:hypothetical protein
LLVVTFLLAAAADTRLEARFTEEIPRIDGRLDEALWSAAQVATGFVQWCTTKNGTRSAATQLRGSGSSW